MNKLHTRQTVHRTLLRKIANQSDFATNARTGLDNLMVATNAELTPAFELYPNEPADLVLNVGANFVTNPQTSIRHTNPAINKQFPNFTSGTITLPASSGGVITVSPTIVTNPTLTISANAFIKGLIECDSLGNLSITLGSEGATEALAGNPGINPKAYQIGMLVIQTVSGVVQNVTGERIIQFQGGGGSGSGGGDGVLEPIDGYQWLETDNFEVLGSAADSKVITAGYTNAAQDLGKGLYNIKCDKTPTVVTSSGTSLIISAAPSFTVQAGDIVYMTSGLRSGQWRRIATVNSQTDFTLDAAWTGGDAAASDTLMVSQAVWSKDLVNLGDAAQQTRARDFLSGDITQIAIDYLDSLASGDDVADQASAARVAVSASNEGLVSASGVPISSAFSPIYERPAGINIINDYVLSENTAQERLHLVFFASPTNSSVTAECNLLRYDVSFFDEPYIDNGGAIDSAFCMSDGSGTEINCAAPTVVLGKTRVQLNWSYVAGVNAGTTRGQLQVFVDGLEIPRFVSGATLDAYYTEILNPVTQVYDIVEFHTDLSSPAVSIEIIKGAGVIDTSSQNTADLLTLQNTAITTEAYRQSFDSFVNSENKLVPFDGAPGPTQFRSQIQNRAPIIDPGNSLDVQIGKRRIPIASATRINGEFGPNNEAVYSVPNDYLNRIRLVGEWTNKLDINGERPQTSRLNSFAEIVFWGTGLNMLTALDNTGTVPDLRVSVDGGAEGPNIWVTPGATNPLASKGFNPNQIINIATNLTPGLHTVKIRLNNTPSSWAWQMFGVEILNESTTLNVRPGSAFAEGSKNTLATAQTPAIASGFANQYGTAGARGGKVIVYLTKSGEIRKDVQWTDSSQLNLASASHVNEEIARIYSWREFGTNFGSDFKTPINTTSSRAFTLEDGNTVLSGNNVRGGDWTTEGDVLLPNTASSFITIQFIGTGLDIVRGADIGSGAMDAHTISIDGGASIGSLPSLGIYNAPDYRFRQKIVSGLPYGQHVVRFERTAVANSIFSIYQFVVYAPKTPALPASAIKLSEYNILADYSAAGAGISAVSGGVVRQSNRREMVYVNGTGGSSSWSFNISVINSPSGFTLGSNHLNSYIEYDFWGTGFEYRGSTNTNRSTNITVSLNGTAATTANFPTMLAANIGNGNFNAATGVLNMNAAFQINAGFSIRNLPLGRYRIRLNQADPPTPNTLLDILSFDIITPCHILSYKNPLAYHNDFAITPGSVLDVRKFSGSESLQAQRKSVSIAFGITADPTTTSSLSVPMPDMNVTHFSRTGRIRISTTAYVYNNTAGALANMRTAVNGSVLGGSPNYIITTPNAANILFIGGSIVVEVPLGFNFIQIFWSTNAGTLTALLDRRILTVEDI